MGSEWCGSRTVVVCQGNIVSCLTLTGCAGEGGSEDPVLTGALATAWTQGLQKSTDDPNRIQVAVTLKHMVANSLESTIGWSPQEAGGWFTRHNISVNISNFTLSDAYFPGFRAAIKHAGAKGIMCSCMCT